MFLRQMAMCYSTPTFWTVVLKQKYHLEESVLRNKAIKATVWRCPKSSLLQVFGITNQSSGLIETNEDQTLGKPLGHASQNALFQTIIQNKPCNLKIRYNANNYGLYWTFKSHHQRCLVCCESEKNVKGTIVDNHSWIWLRGFLTVNKLH